MEEEFDKLNFHSEISDKVAMLNESFGDVVNIFTEACEQVENKEDISFAGGGIHSLMELFSEYQNRLMHLDQAYHKRFGDLQVNEDRMNRFERMVLESLEDIPITDAFDER